MSVGAELAAAVRELGTQAGLSSIGICVADPFEEVAATMKRRLASGIAGRLTFTYRSPEIATDVRRSFPWAQRIVVGAASYLPAAGTPRRDAGTGRVARFAVEDFYPLVQKPLVAISALLQEYGYRAEVLSDDNRLVDRAAAVRAGVGWWGKNTMVLTPHFGPWQLLGSVVTDAVMPTTKAMKRDCGSCVACLPACPTGALIAPGVLDAELCIAYWAQTSGVIPINMRRAMGDRVYGCDECLDACPPGGRLLAASEDERGSVDLVEMLRATDDQLMARYGHFYIPKRRPRYLRRNALIALGNVGGHEHLGVLRAFLSGDDWLLRAHAAWAAGEIGGRESLAMLDEQLRVEPDPRVREEISAAKAIAEHAAHPSV